MKFRCPVCKNVIPQPVEGEKESFRYFPFCSERCKLVDLGAWFDCEYKITDQAKRLQIGEEPYQDNGILSLFKSKKY
ncbi:MAG: DNA gyrase inhibitor YacG [Planctomycetes bacterium]|nr:DNA gyrase inhibitor YacG [Planctomycetota bacterium]